MQKLIIKGYVMVIYFILIKVIYAAIDKLITYYSYLHKYREHHHITTYNHKNTSHSFHHIHTYNIRHSHKYILTQYSSLQDDISSTWNFIPKKIHLIKPFKHLKQRSKETLLQ